MQIRLNSFPQHVVIDVIELQISNRRTHFLRLGYVAFYSKLKQWIFLFNITTHAQGTDFILQCPKEKCLELLNFYDSILDVRQKNTYDNEICTQINAISISSGK